MATVSPSTVEFDTPTGSAVITLINASSEAKTFKVQTKRPTAFKVFPSNGQLPPESHVRVSVSVMGGWNVLPDDRFRIQFDQHDAIRMDVTIKNPNPTTTAGDLKPSLKHRLLEPATISSSSSTTSTSSSSLVEPSSTSTSALPSSSSASQGSSFSMGSYLPCLLGLVLVYLFKIESPLLAYLLGIVLMWVSMYQG
jgi:hypothetical protein